MGLQKYHSVLDLSGHGIQLCLVDLLLVGLRHTLDSEGYHGCILSWQQLQLLNHTHHLPFLCFFVLVWPCENLILSTLKQVRQL